jgi:hypothetical protein
MRATAFIVGLLLVAITFSSLVRALIVPRGHTSRLAQTDRVVHLVFRALTARVRRYEARDRIFAAEGAVALLALLGVWLTLLTVGFGLMLVGLEDVSFGAAVRESASSTFTLGFATTPHAAATVLDVLAAAAGLIVIALQIAYLPTLYSAFNRREALVTTLESRAGTPAWGPEILARHTLVGITDNLPLFYAEWERWAAELAETHSNYPVLVMFRSPKPLRNWLVGLLAVMDSAALYQSSCPTSCPSEARLCLRMGFTALRDIATVLKIPFDPDPLPHDPITLTRAEYDEGLVRMQAVGFEMERTADEAWPHFASWRVNYEAIAYTLADRIDAVPGPWTGSRRHMPGAGIAPDPPPNRTPEYPDGVPAAKAAEIFGDIRRRRLAESAARKARRDV